MSASRAIRGYVFDAYGRLFDVHSVVEAGLSMTWRQKQLEYTWPRARRWDATRISGRSLKPRCAYMVRRIGLTAREYALLEYFLRNAGRVLSRALIAQHVWGVSFDTFTNVIDVYVNYLRRKIDADFEPRLIHTVRRLGLTATDKRSRA